MANIKKSEVIREAENSVSHYKKMTVLIDNTMREMFFYRDLLKGCADDQVNQRIKEQAAKEKANMDRYVLEKAFILDVINEMESEQLQEVLKCVYIDNKSLVLDLGYTPSEAIKIKDEALFEYGKLLRERKKEVNGRSN